jgi:hypothetical protein
VLRNLVDEEGIDSPDRKPEIPVGLDSLRGATPGSRYRLTVEGQKYFQQVLGTFGQTGGLCYGQKTVDSVLKWGQSRNDG